jgi:hypothetical protein
MRISFFSGLIEKEQAEFRAFWAESDFGCTYLLQGKELIQGVDIGRIVSSQLITSLELPGLEREDVGFLIQRILEGGYLEKPGVAGKGDAVLFMLVNEALHELARVADEETEE